MRHVLELQGSLYGNSFPNHYNHNHYNHDHDHYDHNHDHNHKHCDLKPEDLRAS